MILSEKKSFHAFAPALLLLGFIISLAATFAANSAQAAAVTFGTGVNEFAIEFVTIGNPGNAADTTGNPNPVGAVGYAYDIGKYEISRDMVTKANAVGTLGISLQNMSSTGGNGVDRPATGISWNEAARFVNWLNVNSGYASAYKFALQPGDAGYSANSNMILLWADGDAGYDAANLFRNSGARYVLPDLDEWYKAAYYDPNHGGPSVDGYWDYATGSDVAPTAVAAGTAAGSAVYGQASSAGPADVANAGGLSPYGTMAQGGNAMEWLESAGDLVNDAPNDERVFRGGLWSSAALLLQSTAFNDSAPNAANNSLGFRVAAVPVAVPEPSTAILIGFGFAAATRLARRRSGFQPDSSTQRQPRSNGAAVRLKA